MTLNASTAITRLTRACTHLFGIVLATSVLNGCGGGSSGTSNGSSSSTAASDSSAAGSDVTNEASTCKPLKDRVRTTSITLPGGSFPSNNYTPLIIAPKELREDGSLLAWRERASTQVRVGTLNAQDQLTGVLAAVPGFEVHDLKAYPEGPVMAVVDNDPDIYSNKYCYGASTSDKPYCLKMDLVGLDNRGAQRFRSTLTGKANVDSDGARFIWWYDHGARIARSNDRYGVYYTTAGSWPRPGVPGEVDIHQGDALKFVGFNGALLDGGWNWGCSHSLGIRFAFNGQFAAACRGDAFPNALRINMVDAQGHWLSQTDWLSNTNHLERELGGLVPDGNRFFVNYISKDNGTPTLHLAKFTNANVKESDAVIAAANNVQAGKRPYMAKYGSKSLIVGWLSNDKLNLAIVDRATGKIVEGPVVTDASIDGYQEFVPASNGAVTWAYSVGDGTARINRVEECAGQ